MNDQLTIRNQNCPNQSCLGKSTIAIHSRKDGRLRCTKCRKTWVAHIGTAMYRLRINPSKMDAAEKLFSQKVPIRKIAKTLNVSTKTIQRWKSRNKVFFTS